MRVRLVAVALLACVGCTVPAERPGELRISADCTPEQTEALVTAWDAWVAACPALAERGAPVITPDAPNARAVSAEEMATRAVEQGHAPDSWGLGDPWSVTLSDAIPGDRLDAVALHEVGHFAGHRGHHDAVGVMSSPVTSESITAADVAGFGIDCGL